MTNPTGPGGAAQPGPSDIEGSDKPERQAPGYNETGRAADDAGGEVNQAEPEWRPGEDAGGHLPNAGMQGEGEPGRAERDSTGGVEGGPEGGE